MRQNMDMEQRGSPSPRPTRERRRGSINKKETVSGPDENLLAQKRKEKLVGCCLRESKADRGNVPESYSKTSFPTPRLLGLDMMVSTRNA